MELPQVVNQTDLEFNIRTSEGREKLLRWAGELSSQYRKFIVPDERGPHHSGIRSYDFGVDDEPLRLGEYGRLKLAGDNILDRLVYGFNGGKSYIYTSEARREMEGDLEELDRAVRLINRASELYVSGDNDKLSDLVVSGIDDVIRDGFERDEKFRFFVRSLFSALKNGKVYAGSQVRGFV